MKNLSETQTGIASRCVPSEKGERTTPPEKTFTRRPEIQFQSPKYRAKIQWMIDDFDSFHAALLRKLSLGSLPKRAAKYACADFDLEDESEYCGDDGEAVTGNLLAGVTAYIVRCARDPIDYLFSLKNVPAQVIEPIKTYLRVKLAMGRLAAEIASATQKENTINVIPDRCFAQQTTRSGTSSVQTNVEVCLRLMPLSTPESKTIFLDQRPCTGEVPHQVRDDRGGVYAGKTKTSPKPSPAFKYHTSPARTYGFKEMTAQYGYDPRDTSVYWIEKRANALRRRWKKYGRERREDPATAIPKPSINHSMDSHLLNEPCEPILKYFEPADADYNSVRPPVQMPDGPPKAIETTQASTMPVILQPHSDTAGSKIAEVQLSAAQAMDSEISNNHAATTSSQRDVSLTNKAENEAAQRRTISARRNASDVSCANTVMTETVEINSNGTAHLPTQKATPLDPGKTRNGPFSLPAAASVVEAGHE